MIVLECDGTVAIIDPTHGGEILDLIGSQGERPLGRPPFAYSPQESGDLDEPTWTDRYRGGWQLVAPNAGTPSVVDGDRHGFHGGASVAEWSVIAHESHTVTLYVENHGLGFTRRYALEQSRMRIETSVDALVEPRPLVAVEHVVVGVQILDPEVSLDVSPGIAFEIEEPDGSLPLPTEAPAYPEVLMLDGAIERMGSWRLDDVGAQTFAVSEMPEGWAHVRNRATGEGLRLTWDVSVLPHMWVWHENRSSGGPWRHATELLGIEPAMVPHSIGLDGARESGHATIVVPGEPVSWWIEAELIAATAARPTRWTQS
jgi:hypothetical protein